MTESIKPRPHAELAARYMADSTLNCWLWVSSLNRWSLVGEYGPQWESDLIYHVGHEPPTEPPQKMCELAGVRFPAPLTEMKTFQDAWAISFRWNRLVNGEYRQKEALAMGLVQATPKGAIAQVEAMCAALKQAIERAK